LKSWSIWSRLDNVDLWSSLLTDSESDYSLLLPESVNNASQSSNYSRNDPEELQKEIMQGRETLILFVVTERIRKEKK